MSQKVTSGLISIIAVGAGNGGAITNAYNAIPMPLGNPPQAAFRVVVTRVSWYHNLGFNATLLIGYGDRTVAGSLFRQVSPTILMINGIHDDWVPPIIGNTPQGFMIDTTAVTGTLGNVLIESPTAGIGAAPNNVFVVVEAEIF